MTETSKTPHPIPAKPAGDWMDKASAETGQNLARERGHDATAQQDAITGHWGVRVKHRGRAFYFDQPGLLLDWLDKTPAQPVNAAPTPASFNGTGWATPVGGAWQPVVAQATVRPHSRAYAEPTLTILKAGQDLTAWRLGLSLALAEALEATVPKVSHVRFYVEHDRAARFIIVPATGETDATRAATLTSRRRHRQAGGPAVASLLATLDPELLPDETTAYPAQPAVLPGIGAAWIVDLADPGRQVTARHPKGDQ